MMKTWNNPELVALDMTCTERGTKFSANFDEVRVDQDGNYWYSFSSGVETSPAPTSEVIVVD